MPRRRPGRGEIHEITVDRLAYGGNGVGRLPGDDGKPGMAVFVPRSAPDDRLRIRLDRVYRRHAEASIQELLSPGDSRAAPECRHYEEGCGGCSWQHLNYRAQLTAKETVVRDSLERIGGLARIPLAPIIGADAPWFYRNKMEFTFNARDGLGLHAGGDWRRVVAVSECRLQSELAMRLVELARDFAAEHGLSSWDPVQREGFLRQLVIRHGQGTGETMVALVTSPGRFPQAERFAERVAAIDGAISSILHATRGTADSSPIESITLLYGEETIRENIAGLSFEIGLQTFFQTNTAQAAAMLALVRDHVAEGFLAAGEHAEAARLVDVFCGVGFLTLGLAAGVDEAIGVEIVEPSIAAARRNAEINGIENAHFYAGDARRTLPEVIDRHGPPGIVVLDPPRDGAGGKVMRRIARSGPQRIVYVSCNPTTLARDLKDLKPFGYRATSVQPIDLFPQTYHVETIVTMDRAADPMDGAPGAG